MDMKRMEAVAVDLAKIRSGHREFHDADIGRMADLADSLDSKAYAGGWVQMVNYATQNTVPAACASLATSTPGTALLPTTNPVDAFLPANSLHIGSRLRVRAWGSIANAGAFTFVLALAIGVVGTNTVVTSFASATPVTAASLLWVDMEATVIAIGAASTASIEAGGHAFGIGAAAATAVVVAPAALSATWSTQNANQMQLTGWWGTGQAGITLYGYGVEQLELMAAGVQVTQAQINAQAGSLAIGLRTALQQIQTFQVWLAATGSAGLQAVGFTSGDAATMISAFSDMNDLANIYLGAASTHLTGTYNYTTFAKLLTAYA